MPATRSKIKKEEIADKFIKKENVSTPSGQSLSSLSAPKKKRRNEKPRNESFSLKQNINKNGIYPMNKFPYHLAYKTLDLRKRPELYRPGLGEQGVLMVEPYKSELLPYWKFKDAQSASTSSEKLKSCFYEYIKEGDFIGADMARKFIQMGFTRSRRYANHKGGRKYSYKDGKRGEELPRSVIEDKVKAESAQIFKLVLEEVKKDAGYLQLRQEFEESYRDTRISEGVVKAEE